MAAPVRLPLRPLAPNLQGDLAPLVAIGASAGGPAALSTLLKQVPREFPGSIVIVQHIDAAFAPGMAQWLQQQSVLRVRLAVEGDLPRRGEVLLAGSNHHLVFKEGSRLAYVEGAPTDVYRPSVDAFFHSIVRHWDGKATGVLLTGMGRDGAAGLKALRDNGYHTLAQDQKSCAVYGMPKAAVALNAAVDVLPVSAMAARLQALLAGA